MQALYSGFSYIGSEARRATKPIVETLAPIVPTFGCGEAAVKQSISSCIHEMEAVSIEDVHVAKNGMGWNDSFMNIKKIVLYPFHHPEAKFGVSSKCHTSTEAELGILANVTSNINQQLESWSIPFRFEVSKDRKHMNEFLTTKKNNCLTNTSKEENIALFFGHCDDLQRNGKPLVGTQAGCHVGLLTGAPKRTVAHELAHVFAPHIFDAIPLTSLHPDLLEATCDPVSHGDELITSLSYASICRDRGFSDTQKHHLNSRGQWGQIDLTLAKLSTHREHDDTHVQIHAEGVDKSYEWIRQNYGHRAAEQFVGSFVKSAFIHSMSAIVARNVKSELFINLYRPMIHLLGNMLHLGMMNQLTTPFSAVVGCAGSGMMGRTAKALTGVIGEAALMSSFVQLMRGNSDVMLQLVYATCGTAAGAAFSQLINGFIETCAPTNHEQRQVYLDLTKPSGMTGVIQEIPVNMLDIAARKFGVNTEAVKENIYSRMPTLIQGIVTIDKAVANVIEQYVSLQVMTSWIWKSDQQKADAQVQASIEQLSDTLVNVQINSDNLIEPVSPLDMVRDTDDDPLQFMDGAAFTGISNASLAKNQQVLQARKQQ